MTLTMEKLEKIGRSTKKIDEILSNHKLLDFPYLHIISVTSVLLLNYH
jgi:hypothetical protein